MAQNRYATDYLVRAHCAFVEITNGNIFVTRKDKAAMLPKIICKSNKMNFILLKGVEKVDTLGL